VLNHVCKPTLVLFASFVLGSGRIRIPSLPERFHETQLFLRSLNLRESILLFSRYDPLDVLIDPAVEELVQFLGIGISDEAEGVADLKTYITGFDSKANSTGKLDIIFADSRAIGFCLFPGSGYRKGASVGRKTNKLDNIEIERYFLGDGDHLKASIAPAVEAGAGCPGVVWLKKSG
jgi:hypothetical protein